MMLGIAMTVLNLVFNVILIRGLGPIPAFGTKGSAMGTAIAPGSSPPIRSGSCGAARGSSRFRAATASGPTGASSDRCSVSACRPAFKGSP